MCAAVCRCGAYRYVRPLSVNVKCGSLRICIVCVDCILTLTSTDKSRYGWRLNQT